jgi:hypothetical protein
MGQRAAAEQTRNYFALETFSHTTLGRALKRMELLIDNGYGQLPVSAPSSSSAIDPVARKFRTAEQTRQRRYKVITFLAKASGYSVNKLQRLQQSQLKCKRPPYKGEFIDASHKISRHILLKYDKLML